MDTAESREKSEALLLSVIVRMKEHTGPSLSRICGCFAEGGGELVGSATVVQLRGKPYLITAQHVAAKLFTESSPGERKFARGLCHSLGDGEEMIQTGPSWYTWPTPQDVAIAAIDAKELAQSAMVPLEPAKFALNTESLDDDLYFVHGWPDVGSRFTTLAGPPGIHSRSQPYGGWLTTETTWEPFDPKIHLAITYPATEIIDERLKTTTLPIPGGMSGSLLWKTNFRGSSEWSPAHATVVGLVHRFDQDAQCLIATRIEYVKGLLRMMLRQEYAFSLWLNRGSPPNDDWTDWFDAEREIISL